MSSDRFEGAGKAPPLKLRAGEGVKAESVKERTRHYQMNGHSRSEALEMAIEDAISALESLEIEIGQTNGQSHKKDPNHERKHD